jgi:hypothetical protein
MEYDFKLCSKLTPPSALMLNRPEATISNQANKEYLAIEVLTASVPSHKCEF